MVAKNTTVLIVIDRISDARKTGSAHFINFELIKTHVDMGLAVSVVVVGNHSKAVIDLLSAISVESVYFIPPLRRSFWQSRLMGKVVRLRSLESLPSDLKKCRFDVGLTSVLTTDDVIHLLYLMKKSHIVSRSVVWEHRSSYHARPSLKSYLHHRLLRTGLKGADKWLAVSNPLAMRVTDLAGVHGKSCGVMSNTVSSLLTPDEDPSSSIIDEISFPKTDFVFSVQNWGRGVKGIDTLFAMCTHLREQGSELKFVLAGNHPEGIREIVDKKGLSDKVEFVGRTRPEVTWAYFRKCSLYVNVSNVETFSISTAEALVFGKPVVVTRSGGPEDFVRPGVDGEVIEPSDAEALAEAVELVYQRCETYDHFVISENALKQFSNEAWQRKWHSFYQIHFPNLIERDLQTE